MTKQILRVVLSFQCLQPLGMLAIYHIKILIAMRKIDVTDNVSELQDVRLLKSQEILT